MTATALPPRPAGPTRRPPARARLGTEARVDAGVRAGSLALLWLTQLWLVFLWVREGGVQDLGGASSALLSTGRLSGLVASALLLVQVLMMARIPVLERAWGQDRLARLHRLVGFTSFNLMIAHIGLITWGYAAGRLTATPGTIWDLTWDYPGMLLAVAGSLCLVMVVVTSIRAARRRLRYESWHLLHLYAYLGAGLALPHQLWTGQEFLRSTASTIFWWGLWIAAVVSVLVWRVARPAWRSWRHSLRVTAVVAEDDDTFSVYLAGRALHRMPVEAGQFLTWRFPGRPGWTRANPYSLSAAPDGRQLRITVKELGDGSRSLRSLTPGTRAVVEGPYGRLTARPRTQRKVLLIGAGVGITPLRALAEGLGYAPGEATLIYRYADRPLFRAELEALADHRGLRIVALPGPRRRPDSWFSAHAGVVSDRDALLGWVPDLAEHDVYVCGPQEWADAVRRTTALAGLPADQLHLETFAW
ncbi:ferric reductase-like transmembrane domain-containing protein [soil metagenome]